MVARALVAAGLIGVVVISSVTVWGGTAQAGTGINHEINFQGKVVNTDGTNVADGTYSFVFNLYTAASGGTAIWSETVSLPVTAGIFQYDLGSDTGNPLPGSVDFNTDSIYLGMAFNGDPEMSPRIQFTAAPYAFNSEKLGGLTASQFAQLNPASAQSGSLNVTGSVQAATSLQAPLVDTATGVALNIGTGTATSVTIGRTTTPFTIQGTSASTITATSGGFTSSLTFQAPSGANDTLVLPDAGRTICTTVASTCSGTYATSLSGTYLAKNTADTSSAAITAGNYLYGFTNSQATPTTGGVLDLSNGANTGDALYVTASGNPAAATNALIVANNTAAAPSGNLLALQNNGTNQFSVDYQGNISQVGGTSTTATINGQTISSAANFTGTVTAATSVLTPLVDTAAAGTLGVGTTNATTIDVGTTGSAAQTIAIGSGTGADTISLGSGALASGTDTISIGDGATSAGIDALTLGSTNSTSSTLIQGGVNGTNATVSLQAASGAYLAIGTVNANTIQMGSTGASANSSTVQIASTTNGTGTQSVSIGSSANAANVVTLQGGATTETVANAGATVSNGASATAFAVTNGTSNLLQVDTANNNIFIGGNNSGALQPWTTSGVVMSANRIYATSVYANGYIYEIGGSSNSGITAATNTVFSARVNSDGSIGSWTTSANTLPGTVGKAASVTANGYAYVFGGDSGTGALSSVWYAKLNADGTTGAWQTAVNALPAAIEGESAAVANGYVYVIGGGSTSVYYAKLKADGSVGAWTTSTNLLPAARSNGVSVVANGFVYLLGGNATTVYYAALNSNGSTGAWQTATNALPTTLEYATGVVADGYVYYMAGTSSFNNTGAVATVSYAKLNADGSVGTWATNANALPTPVWGGTSVMANGYVYVIAGNNSSGPISTSYYASTQRVEVGGSLDLVGYAGQTLSTPGEPGVGSTGGSLTAGNIASVGNLSVAGQASFAQGVSAGGNLGVNGYALFENGFNSTTAFQVQNATGYSVLGVDTTNGVLDLGTSNHVAGQILINDGASSYTGTIALQSTLPGSATYQLPAVAGAQVICTTLSTAACGSVYQAAGNYLLQSPAANDASTSSFAGYQYGFTQNNTGAAGNLQLTNAGTSAALAVSGSGNPSGTNALVVINNSAVTPSGNSLDIQQGGVNELSVDYNGNINQAGGSSTTDTINGQTISASANFTGTVTAATSVLAPLVDAATAGGTLALGTTNATGGIDLNQNTTVSGTAYVNTNSTAALKVEQSGVHNNTLVVDTTNGRVGVDMVPNNGALDVSGITISSQYYTSGGLILTSSGGDSISKQASVGTGGVTAGDVVVYDTTAAGQDKVIDTTTARDPRVMGIAQLTETAGAGGEYVVTSGTATVNADTGAINVGDQLVTSTTAGDVMADNNATTGILGIALSSKASGATGTVVVSVRPVGGQTNPNFAGNVSIQGSTGVTVGNTSGNVGMVNLLDGTADTFTGTLKLQGSLPGSSTYELPNVAGTQVICTTLSTSACSSTYQLAGSYLLQNPTANDASTSNFAGYQYSYTQSNTGAAGNLQLTNAGTSAALAVSGSGNPSGTNALVVINNTAGTASGNSLDIQAGGVNELSVDSAGNISQINGTATTDTVNGQTISAAANFTGTVTAATSVLAPLVDTATAGTLAIGSNNATAIDLNQNTAVAAGKSFTANGSSTFQDASNSTTAFRINDQSGYNLVNVDTVNGLTTITGTTSDATKNALIVSDSNGDNLAQIRNDGYVALGRNSGAASTVGKTTVGGTNDSGNVSLVQATKVTTGPVAATLNSITVYIVGSDVSPNNKYILGIYADNAGTPGALIASSAQGTITPASWNTLAVSASLAANTVYWLSFSTNTTQGTINFVPYDTGAAGIHAFESGYANAGVSNPATFSVSGTSAAQDSIYANVSESGALGTLLTVDPTSGVGVSTPTAETSAFYVQNASNNSVLSVDTSVNQVLLGKSNAVSGTLVFADGSSANTGKIMLGGTLGANATYDLPNLSGTQTLCTSIASSCSATYQVAGSYQAAGNYLVQQPATSGANTIAPNAASVVGLTVKGTTGTAADVMDIYNSAATPTLQDYFDANGSLNVSQLIQPTSTNAVDLGTSGAAFRTGYFGTGLQTPSVTSTGALSVTSGGTSALTLDTTGAAAVNIGNTHANAINIGNGAITTAITGSATVSANTTVGTANSGSLFKNNGATQNVACAYTGVSGTFTLTTAGKTVNDCTTFTITDTAAATLSTIAAPAAGAGSIIYIDNLAASAASVTVLGATLPAGDSEVLLYDGSNWTTGAAASAGNVTLQQAYNYSAGASPSILETSANGAVTVQSAYAAGIAAGSELFGVHAATSGDTLGGSVISATSYGLGVNLGTDTAVSGYDLQFGGNANRTIGVISATAANQQGGNLTVTAGNANGSSTGAIGGALNLFGGNAAGTGSNNGGLVAIQGGTSSNNATAVGGAVTITGGSAGAAAGAMGGAVAITGGAGTSTGTGAAGNVVTVTGGSAGGTGNNAGGNVTVQGGASTGTGTGGQVNINGGAASSTGAGGSIVIQAAGGGASAASGSGAGGSITLQGGSASGSNNNNGGSIFLSAGTGAGTTGLPGVVSISSPVFNSVNETFAQTSNSQAFTAAQAYLDQYGTIVMNVTGAYSGATVTMPTPTNQAAGRVVYVSAAAGSVAFTLAAAGMSSVNMSAGNTAALIWNGSTWSGTTTASSLQQVYNNTSTAPASIITTSTTKNILFQAGIGDDNANLFQVGNSLAAPVLHVDTTNTATGANLADNSGLETGGTAGWSAYVGTGSTSSIALNTNPADLAAGSGSLDVNITTTGSGGAGADNDLNGTALSNTAGTIYNVSFNVLVSTATAPTLAVQYFKNNTDTTPDATCTVPSNGTPNNTAFFKYTCYFTNSGNTKTTTNHIRIVQTDATWSGHIYIDNLFVGAQGSSASLNSGVLQVGGPLSQGLTILQLDSFASDPVTGAVNQNMYGSMYYSTTLGRIQCYEADGWGSCGAAPNTNLILEPEYAGAVLNPGVGTDTHIGTMTADVCSYAMTINPLEGTLCANPGDEYNFYRWTTSQVAAQTYSIFVKYQLPPTFGGFLNASTLKMVARVSSTTNASVDYVVYKVPAAGGAATECGTPITVTTAANTWQNVAYNSNLPTTGGDITTCGFSAGDIIMFRVDVSSDNNAYAYAGRITFTMLGK